MPISCAPRVNNYVNHDFFLFPLNFESLRQEGQYHLPLGGHRILKQSKWNHLIVHFSLTFSLNPHEIVTAGSDEELGSDLEEFEGRDENLDEDYVNENGNGIMT